MGKVIAWTSVLVLFLALFQAAILSNLAFLPAMPDLVLIAVVYVAFMNGSLAGSTAGFGMYRLRGFLFAAIRIPPFSNRRPPSSAAPARR